ncbi:hypothetical protein [Rhodopirellula bahusiensis]|uniref:hypothetical protein n=1 Tax=Rhodopirellula bahusiensis TaxID=2014065 RepID=UPI003267BE69
MLITLQIPILDLRGFLLDTGRLRKPPWPIPDPGTDFVRNFGPIQNRPRGGVPGWLGEGDICNAKNAIRCDREVRLRHETQRFLRIAFRRFYFDGLAVGKFEIGFASKRHLCGEVSANTIQATLSDILRLPVRIPLPGTGHVHGELASIGNELAGAYLLATTRVQYPDAPRSALVRSGAPLLLIECNDRERISLPFYSRRIPEQHGIKLSHSLVPYRKQSVRLWFLDQSTSWDWDLNERSRDPARRLRLYLQRLHAEHECLRIALRGLAVGAIEIPPRSPQSNVFQQYLNEATRRIGLLRNKTSKNFNDTIYEIAICAITAMRPGEIASLQQVLDRLDMRPNVRRKVDRYAEEWTNITIIEHVENNYMGDVFKDIQNSIIATRGSIAEGIVTVRMQQNDAVADSIQSLDDLIASVADSELPVEKKNECLELLNGLTDEIKKPEPSKPILKTIGESLYSVLSKVPSISKGVATCFEVLKPLWS